MAIAKEKEETESHEECINTAICTAIALQSIRLFQSLLSAVAMGLNIPSGSLLGLPMAMKQAKHVAATSLCIACDLHGSNVATKH